MELKTVANAARILTAFDQQHPVWGITELARHLGMDKGSVHHLVVTLQRAGLLARLPNAKYALSMRLFELGMVAVGRLNLQEVARPVLHQLQMRFDETAHLAVLSGAYAVFVEKVESSRYMRMSSAVGSRTPLHCSAVGKVLLAYHMELLPVVIQRMTAFTPQTITQPGRLLEVLQAVRDEGYAVNDQETEPELCGVAAPVFDHTGSVVAALSLAGPVGRMRAHDLDAVADHVRQAGAEVSRAIGYRPSSAVLP